MPITRSAKKAHRASLIKRTFNIRRKQKVSQTVKSLKKLVLAGDKKEAMLKMREVQKALDKAAKANTINKNTASRKKSRLSRMVKKIA
ncbi:MAG: 30S ribosomal protein S20 [bacterium]